MTHHTIETKECIKCGKTFPATTEFFHQAKRNRDGLHSYCKMCKIDYNHKWWKTNPDARREYYIEHKEQYNQQSREYHRVNRERIAEKAKQRRLANKDKKSEYDQQRYQINREEINEKNRQWRKSNRAKGRIYKQRRRARRQSLSDTFTIEQWQICLEYFHHCCAVCGSQLRDLFGNVEPHADHWVPLVSPDCPGTVAINMICLCSTCNHSKNDKLPDQWLERKFGKRKAKQILARIHAYFEWITT